ncbi:MFS transporter [Francisella sp. 19X1-34]|uniref:MFS transporter n=1 Tax=Francisella sp. 19X1-34 TaxID=3087177 RepID=UPI002E3204B2|nr:MFS transporter [Francisella sp. 19X1-34]MED7788389.1 MFS transporter [Francisella sp. 19X1-34]
MIKKYIKVLIRDDMGDYSSNYSKIVFGMPTQILWGFIAIAIFMTGDGIEVAFLSKYLVHHLGFRPDQAAMVFTIYGATSAISSWFSGVLAEVYTPRKLMIVGALWWILFHALFMIFGIHSSNYFMILLFYGIRGFAYPMFFYGFFVWVVQKTPPHRLASAVGWIWSMFTIGYGIVSSFLASFAIVALGFETTLWLSILFVAAGGLIIFFCIKKTPEDTSKKYTLFSEKLKEMSKGVTLIYRNKNIFMALIIRIICNLSLFGFPVIMPLFYTSGTVGFKTSQWLLIWGIVFVIQPFSNVIWGAIGDRIGWMFQMRWFGFVGCGLATLSFYYLPYFFGNNFLIAAIAALFFGLTVTSFVPMGAIFPMIEPEHKGAAVSVQNLGGGLANFMGPALATLLLPSAGIKGVVICYAVLYFFAAFLTLFIKVNQPKG